MKFLTFAQGAGTCLGSPLDGGDVINLTSLLRQEWGVQATVPRDVLELIELGDEALATAGRELRLSR